MRAAWDNEGKRWLFSVVDVIVVLTGSKNPHKYWSVMKTRLKKADDELATNCSKPKITSKN